MQVSRSIYRLTMPKLLQINTVINSGSTGRIAEDIGRIAIANERESYIAFGKINSDIVSQLKQKL